MKMRLETRADPDPERFACPCLGRGLLALLAFLPGVIFFFFYPKIRGGDRQDEGMRG